MKATSSWKDLVVIGEVARTHGRHGEVIVNPLTDFPERFHNLTRVFVHSDEGEVVALRLEAVRQQKGRPIMKFEGVSEIGEAERLAGREIRIPESELVALPADSLFHFQVVGCRVSDQKSGYLGVVTEVLPTGGTDVLVVQDVSGEETLIPLCKEICRRIDPERKEIEIDAPEGLMTINAR